MTRKLMKLGRISQLLSAAHEHGARWSIQRSLYELQLRSGLHQFRFQRRDWARAEAANWLSPGTPNSPEAFHSAWLESRPAFFFAPWQRPIFKTHLHRIMGRDGVLAVRESADDIGRGIFTFFFSAATADLGFPPRWHVNGMTGGASPAAAHWSRLPMWSERYGDMKYIWEPGRFASAYKLARAYWATGDENYPEIFWRLLESWYEQNPPNTGAHWKCGQETALRLMAWCFALYAFADSTSTTPPRLWTLLGAVAAQAERIEEDHRYSELQGNNHAISEGVGLWTVGIMFPWLSSSGAWRERGREILERHARLQINHDGTFVQKSINYHRLMLQDYMYAIRVGEVNGESFTEELRERVRAAADFMYRIHDPISGHAPNLGGNDGALILPLNGCDYRDYRPVCSASHYLFHDEPGVKPGPWSEDLLWLFGPEALSTSATRHYPSELSAPEGGYYTIRGTDSWALFRCGPQSDRPAHADMLHVDLWWRGQNIARDPGTYRYYDASPWNNSLAATDVHNTVTVDGLDQMVRGPRFLWSKWSNGRLLRKVRDPSGRIMYVEGEHDGYARLPQPVTHRRALLRAGEVWIVVDELLGQGEHTYRLHWLLDNYPFAVDKGGRRITLATPVGEYALAFRGGTETLRLGVVRGSEATAPRGWISEYYGLRHAALSVVVDAVGPAPIRLITVLAPANWSYSDGDIEQFRVKSDLGNIAIRLNPIAKSAIVAGADYRSVNGDVSLEIGV